MVTTFNTKDLVSFGKYLLSEKREERLKSTRVEIPNSLPYEEQMREVYDADLANWKAEQKIADVMRVMDAVCAESLDPKNYENWEKIRKELVLVRKDL